jgi:preprotein translocase subunit Sec63
VAAGTALHELALPVLVSALGAMRTRALETDAAWLDAAVPDWRKRVVDDDATSASGNTPADPYEVLGVEPNASMAEVTAAFRRAMKAVHPNTSGGASAWLSRAVLEAYKTIRAAHAGGQRS